MVKLFFVLLLCVESLFAWGSTTHKYINKNAVSHLPPSMQKFIDQQSFLETHAVDPDGRKGTGSKDTNLYGENWRHFLDIDSYPNYKNLTPDFSLLISQYGRDVVRKNGTIWWATKWVLDSLTEQLKRGDWNTAYQTGADLGHYVADGHQPLHVTLNYDGGSTSQSGIHSRYETAMMGYYIGNITISKDSVRYIEKPMDFVFSYLLTSNQFVDSVLNADKYAAPPNGLNGGTPPTNYYALLWEKSQDVTKSEIQSATIDLASLWFTAYVNAGLIAKPTSVDKNDFTQSQQFALSQNYPNPFNPTTMISYQLSANSYTTLKVYDVVGREVATLVNEVKERGNYFVQFSAEGGSASGGNASNLPSGIYFYRLQAGNYSSTKKLVLLK